MATYLVRSSHLYRLTRLENNTRSLYGSKHLFVTLPACCVSTRVDLSTLATHRENKLLITNIHYTSSKRSFHASEKLWKKFKESDYETLQVLDPFGQFLYSAEMLVLKKFCQHYHRFTFQEVDQVEMDHSTNATGMAGLRTFKLVDKRKENPGDSQAKKSKIIKFHKDMDVSIKRQKIMEELINQGKVTVTFDQKGGPVELEVRHALKEIADVKERTASKSSCIVASLNEIDSNLLHRLFDSVQKQEASHIADVKELIKVTKNE